MLIFQSTLPREERLLQQYLSHFQLLFQSTLPREERPRALLIYIPDYTISIHAPTRGATKSTALLKLIRKISIHAPTRGATTTNAPSCRIFLFQSTLPREERQIPCWCYVRRQQYFNPRSHERSDRHTGNRSKRCKNFNPRSHERSDLLQLKRILSRHAFQSTLPREERQQYCTKNLFIFIQYRQ